MSTETAPSTNSSDFSLRSAWSWALYDAANSAFPLVITTAVFVLYFKGVVVGPGHTGLGDLLWGWSVSISAILVALTSPFVGALADARGQRKRFLAGYTCLAIVATLLLSQSGPGRIAYAMICFILANAAFEGGMVFYGSLLPFVVPREKIDRWSGIGWACGYLGGLVCLVLMIPAAQRADIQFVTVGVAIWFAVLSLPIFMFVKERPAQGGDQKRPLRSLIATLKLAWREPGMRRFFLAYFLYNDAIITVFTFAAPFATDELGFSHLEVLGLVASVQITGAIGAFGFGLLASKIGNIPTIRITLTIWLFVTVAAFTTALDTRIWDADTVSARAAALSSQAESFATGQAELIANADATAPAVTAVAAAMGTTSYAASAADTTHGRVPSPLRKRIFMVIGLLVGLAMGATQSCSRSFMASVVPQSMSARFFGFYAVAGRFSAIIGPTLFGVISFATGSKAWSVLALALLFGAGLAIIARVREDDVRDGLSAAAAAEAATQAA